MNIVALTLIVTGLPIGYLILRQNSRSNRAEMAKNQAYYVAFKRRSFCSAIKRISFGNLGTSIRFIDGYTTRLYVLGESHYSIEVAEPGDTLCKGAASNAFVIRKLGRSYRFNVSGAFGEVVKVDSSGVDVRP